MENFKKEKVSLWRRIAALALAAALALGLAACDASAVVPGSSTPTVSTAQPAGDGQTANFEMHFLDVADIIALATPLTAGCIRIANLMNSEIIGLPSDMPWAFVFERVDMQPRHPAQLYEALAYFCIGLLMWYLYRTRKEHLHRGFFFGLCLTTIFVFRFFIEFIKENQESFEDGMMLNMGQWLSIPFVAIGIYFMIQGYKKEKK